MSRPTKRTDERVPPACAATGSAVDVFEGIVSLIVAARKRAGRSVNIELIDLYWQIGREISQRITKEGWGKGTVAALSTHIQHSQPGIRGYSSQNLWRMRQFFETYRDHPELSTLLRELPWSSNLHILTRARSPEEREFYLRAATTNQWQVREVARQLDAALFERSVLNPPKLSTKLREIHPSAPEVFKDTYFLEFLGLADNHSEADLHRELLRHLGRFIAELGRDFCFAGSEYPVQVGGKDFALDLLFYHRGLSCLVAIELKIQEFRPEDLGKLNFYLEALDRDVKKPHERPSIGLLLCATKDNEVVEYALNRALSPVLVAEYQAILPPKALLQAKLHEIYARLASTACEPTPTAAPTASSPARRKRK
jgi:predicted nuclease of restriction endonuclease-like (RecB) superfamily